MPDYIYLLENRLSPEQQAALKRVTEVARSRAMPLFLTGGAVRDLTSGSPVRDLDVTVQGNAVKLVKDFEKAGAVVMGENSAAQSLFLKFPGGVRLEMATSRTEHFPKPGKVEYHHPASILDDLRRRDFTVNAMALSLNEGSYGLLLDPLNGVADIDSRLLRLVSPYGFIEEPSRMVRAARLVARYGWTLEDKTQTRYQTGKEEGYIAAISSFNKGYELEEIAHEEDPLKVLRHLEGEGWMKELFPAWTAARVNVAGMEELRETLQALQIQGVSPDSSAAAMVFLTAKMAPKEVSDLKKLFPRQGFVREWDSLDEDAKGLAKQLTSKETAMPSATWKLLTSASPEAVLWLAITGKGAAVQTKYRNFFQVWPESRSKIPYTIMQELRIVPDLPGYRDLQHKLFFEFMDGKLQTEEEIRQYLAPFSPPAPPPPVQIRRARAAKKAEPKKKAAKVKPPAPVPMASDPVAAVVEQISVVKATAGAGKGGKVAAIAAQAPAAGKEAAKAAPGKSPVKAAAPAAKKVEPAKPAAKKSASAKPGSAKAAKSGSAKSGSRPAKAKSPAKSSGKKSGGKIRSKAGAGKRTAKGAKPKPAKKQTSVKKKAPARPKPKSRSAIKGKKKR